MPWGSKQLRRLGEALRDHREPPASCPPYRDVVEWFDELAASVQDKIRLEDWSQVLGDREFSTTSRAKTIETLRQKLQRDRSTPLPSIQDIAGVRFEAPMSLSEQDEIARRIAVLFEHDPDDSRVWKDLRATPHSGYRAVHLWLRLPEGRVEVQVRTALQGAWANVYETAADLFGRGIRYGELPEDEGERELVKTLIETSTENLTNQETFPARILEVEGLLNAMKIPRTWWILAPDLVIRRRMLARRYERLRRRSQRTLAEITETLEVVQSMLLEMRKRGE